MGGLVLSFLVNLGWGWCDIDLSVCISAGVGWVDQCGWSGLRVFSFWGGFLDFD